jgi:hypothetical protein
MPGAAQKRVRTNGFRPWLAQAWRENRWTVLLLFSAVALWLGYLGFQEHARAAGEPRSVGDLIYLAVQLFTMNSGAVDQPVGWKLEVARVLAPLATAVAALEAFAAVMREQFEMYRIRRLRDHVVICGLGSRGHLLARSFKACGQPVVVVDPDPLPSSLRECREQGILVLPGDATQAMTLRLAGVEHARYLIGVCDSDGTNALIAATARGILPEKPERLLTCVLHIEEPSLCATLEESAGVFGGSLRLSYFNVFAGGARAALARCPAFTPEEIASGTVPHVLLLGNGTLAESLVCELARQWEDARHGGQRLRVTLAGDGAETLRENVSARYPEFADSLDLRSAASDRLGRVRQAGRFGPLLSPEPSEAPPLRAVYVCFAEDAETVATSLQLRSQQAAAEVPILICIGESAGLATLLDASDGWSPGDKLQAFGLLDLACQPAMLFSSTLDDLARALHDEYRERSRPASDGSNPALLPWEHLSDEYKASNRKQADHLLAKLEAVGCGLAPKAEGLRHRFEFELHEIERLAKMEHERWRAERTRAGWTHAPGPRDNERKTNPLLVPWEHLEDSSREANRQPIRELPKLLERCGFRVYRAR